MAHSEFVRALCARAGCTGARITEPHPDEVLVELPGAFFAPACIEVHRSLKAPVMALFAEDERAKRGVFTLTAVFLDATHKDWLVLRRDIDPGVASFDSIAKEVYSASLFEREIGEMFGLQGIGNPDLRHLSLHDEVWPAGVYPLRKDSVLPAADARAGEAYPLTRIEGEGVCEVPVGPVHAGIIGPGHFRFSIAGEPIAHLELRLGWTHRGIEKLMEGKDLAAAIAIAERVSGDQSFGHSLAFVNSIEKAAGIAVPAAALLHRALFLELERLYNHVNDIGGMALDVGFSFPAHAASLIKESLLALNEQLTGSRYLRGVNRIGGVVRSLSRDEIIVLTEGLAAVQRDFDALTAMLYGSVSFMDRVDTTGILRRKTAEDFGVLGVAGRASGIGLDLRTVFSPAHSEAGMRVVKAERGDCLARLAVRVGEFAESIRLIGVWAARIDGAPTLQTPSALAAGRGLGVAETWRGPALYWVRIDAAGRIERCKIVDASFRNWQALSYAVLGNIVPDFPLCNKSFDLSYAGNDL